MATIRTVFAQPTADAVHARLDTVADMLGRQFPKVQEMLLEAKEDLTAFMDALYLDAPTVLPATSDD